MAQCVSGLDVWLAVTPVASCLLLASSSSCMVILTGAVFVLAPFVAGYLQLLDAFIQWYDCGWDQRLAGLWHQLMPS